MSKYKFVSMRVSLFCLLITAVLALRTVYADQSVEEDSAVSLDEQANLPLWLQDPPPLPDVQPQIPDHSLLAWGELVAQSYWDGNWEIYRYPAFNNYIRLTDNTASDIHPRLNKGSTRIVFASNRDGDYEIYTMNLDGLGIVQLTNNTNIQDGNPSWSPDGSHILFETQRDGQWEVYVMNADGSNQIRLTFDADYDGMPVWSPDGTRIAFVSRRTGGYRIYTMNVNGSGLMQLSDQPYSFDPTWSPDGSKIAFDADGDGDNWQDLWVMSADGTGESMLIDSSELREFWPRSWSPDGQYLFFTNITFTIQNGNIYWDAAYLHYLDMQSGYSSMVAFQPYAWNPDWQTTDNVLPQSQINRLPPLSQIPGFGVSWAGTDEQSGILAYDVQYRVGENGEWTNWQARTESTSATFMAIPGTTIYFRSRAYDQGNNVESWPTQPDTATTFYSWQLFGNLTDNRGVVLRDIPIFVDPLPIDSPVVTNINGRYHTLLASSGTHTIDITQTGYGDFTATPLNPEETSQTYLPPAENVLLNSSFESGTTSWETGGTIPIAPIYATYNTGNTAVSVGVVCPSPCLMPGDLPLNDEYTNIRIIGDSRGTLHLLSNQSDGMYYAKRTVNGEWSSLTEIPGTLGATDSTSPLVGIDKNDTLHVVWARDPNPPGSQDANIYYAQKPALGSWMPTKLIGTTYGWPDDLAVDQEGRVYLLSKGYILERRTDGVWDTSFKVDDLRSFYGNGLLTITPNNTLHVIWQNTSVDTDHLFYRQRTPSGIWTTTEDILTDFDYNSTYLQHLFADTKGHLHLVLSGSPSSIYYSTKNPSTGWGEIEQISNKAGYVDAVIDGRGILHLVNLVYNDGAYYHYRMPGQNWSDALLLNNEPPRLQPFITTDNFGSLHLFWRDESVWSGEPHYYTTETADSPSTGYLQQTVTIPVNMLNPTLSFMYRTSPDLPDDDTALVVSVTAGITTTQVYTAPPAGNWTLGWMDMQAWAGQTVTVRFAVQQAADDPYLQLFLDSVSLGAAHSDIWVGGTGVTTAEPGDEVVYQLHYGNAGGAGAEDVTITYTLPAEITFVSASVPPITPTTQALVWELGSLPAGDGPYSITITGTVAANVPYLTELTNTAVITAAAPELRTANNTAVSITFIGRLAYLPVIFE